MSAGKTRRLISLPEPDVRILNETDHVKAAPRSAVDVAKGLQKLMLRMKGDCISEDGNSVNYEKMKSSSMFKEYKEMASSLKTIDLDSLNEQERTAFFINIYNALTIHGLVERDTLPKSVLNVQLFWRTTAYTIGGHTFSLDDIEHGVLRGNRPHPASSTLPFDAKDNRAKYAVKKMDPRVHFALVCGAKSCPPINVYTADNLDRALTAATRNFCLSEVHVHELTREIKASKIFQWYKNDFGKTDIDVLRWTIPYLPENRADDLSHLLHLLENQGMVNIKYLDYDWSLNSPPPPPEAPQLTTVGQQPPKL